MPRTSKFIISFLTLVVLFLQAAHAQYPDDRKYGLRLGLDLSRIAVHYIQPYRTDLEVNADVRVDSDLYVAFDGGWNKGNINNKPVFSYNSSGLFVRAGVDYNLLKRQYLSENNIFYIGVRYGVARMRREIPQYTVSDPYWGNISGSFDKKTLLPQWAEFVMGLKAEVLQNLFLGWSFRLRILTTPKVDKVVRPYLIPGYGNGLHNAIFDFNYGISYKIPLWTPHPKPPRHKKTEEKKALPAEKPAEGAKSSK